MGCFEVLESGEGIQDEIARRLQDTGALACGWSRARWWSGRNFPFAPQRPSLLRPPWRWQGRCFCLEFAQSI